VVNDNEWPLLLLLLIIINDQWRTRQWPVMTIDERPDHWSNDNDNILILLWTMCGQWRLLLKPRNWMILCVLLLNDIIIDDHYWWWQ